MKVAELREILKSYDQPALCQIAETLYRAIPKQIKEEKGVDELLKDFSSGKQLTKKQEPSVSFDVLQNEITQFAAYAEAQYYMAPNQYVHKKDRPKWRFITKRYIKALTEIGGEDAEDAADLLVVLYRMLSYACHYYLFRTDDPFASVGYVQTDLFKIVTAKIFYNGITRESIQKAVALAIESNVDRETLHCGLLFALIGHLKTNEAKEMAAESCIDYKKNYYGASFFTDRRFPVERDGFYRDERMDRAVELYFYLEAELGEPETAIEYYWKNNKNKKSWEAEVALFVMLQWLEWYELPALWVAEYEKAAGRGVEPRERLKETYDGLKQGLSFDEIQEIHDSQFRMNH